MRGAAKSVVEEGHLQNLILYIKMVLKERAPFDYNSVNTMHPAIQEELRSLYQAKVENQLSIHQGYLHFLIGLEAGRQVRIVIMPASA